MLHEEQYNTDSCCSSIIETIIKASGGDTSKVKLSYAYGTSYRFRLQAAQEMVEGIKDALKPSPVSVLHWDEKLTTNTLKGRTPSNFLVW